jgi:hypothetical protein
VFEPYTLCFGRNLSNGGAVKLPLDDLTHAHFEGTTGYGKSVLIDSLLTSLIWQGVQVTLIDPAGTLARGVLGRLLATGYFTHYPDAFDRVIFLDTPRGGREGRYFPMNVLSGDYDPHSAANIILEAIKRIWTAMQDGQSTNIETLVKYGTYVLAEYGLQFYPFIRDLLSDPNVYRALVPGVRDQDVRQHFETLKITPKKESRPDIS